MSRDERKDICNGGIAGLLCAVVALCVVCGCDHKEPVQKPDGLHSVVVLPEAAEKRIDDLEQSDKRFRETMDALYVKEHQPTPAPVDYSPILSSIDTSLKAVAAKSEHSIVVAPPADEKRLADLEKDVEYLKLPSPDEAAAHESFKRQISALEKELAELKKTQCKCHCK